MMLKTWSAIVVVLIAALSVLSDATPVTATDNRNHDKHDVTVANKPANPVPVVIGNSKTSAIPVSVTNWPAQTGSGGTTPSTGGATPEDGAQFFREGVTFAQVSNADLFALRPGKRFVVDYLTVTANLTSLDCSLAFVRVYDGFGEVARVVMPLQGNAANLFGATQNVKMFLDAAPAGANPNQTPIQRIDAMLFPTTGCSATDFKLSVAGHYVDRPQETVTGGRRGPRPPPSEAPRGKPRGASFFAFGYHGRPPGGPHEDADRGRLGGRA